LKNILYIIKFFFIYFLLISFINKKYNYIFKFIHIIKKKKKKKKKKHIKINKLYYKINIKI